MPIAPPAIASESPRTLRLRLRRLRASLPDATLARHSRAISAHARRGLRWLQPRTLAGYLGIRGEIDITAVLEPHAAAGVRIALPILDTHRPGHMHFRHWHPGTRLCRNGFGIPEPCRTAPRIWRRELDVVLLPLVAFDATGQRLGMGGGYYDRYFACRRRGAANRPRLIGIAHAFQQVSRLDAQPWDVPLDAVITERGWHWFRR